MKLYIVQNPKGQFFRPRGRGYMDQWQDSIEMAKFYTKLGQAKTQCTIWYGYCPKFGCPHILEYDIDPAKGNNISVQEHADTVLAKKEQKKQKERRDREQYEALRNVETASRVLKTLTPAQKRQLGIPV